MKKKREKLTQEAMEKRDANIFLDYSSGEYNLRELIVKYELSHARIYQIINKEEIK